MDRSWAKFSSIFDKLTKTPSPPVLIRGLKYYRLKCHIRRNCIRFSSQIKWAPGIPIAALDNVILKQLQKQNSYPQLQNCTSNKKGARYLIQKAIKERNISYPMLFQDVNDKYWFSFIFKTVIRLCT